MQPRSTCAVWRAPSAGLAVLLLLPVAALAETGQKAPTPPAAVAPAVPSDTAQPPSSATTSPAPEEPQAGRSDSEEAGPAGCRIRDRKLELIV